MALLSVIILSLNALDIDFIIPLKHLSQKNLTVQLRTEGLFIAYRKVSAFFHFSFTPGCYKSSIKVTLWKLRVKKNIEIDSVASVRTNYVL